MAANPPDSRTRRRRIQLHKSKIRVDKSSGFLGGKKLYKLMVEEEDGREIAVLQATSDKGSFPWWRKGTYCVYGHAALENDESSSSKEKWELVGQISSPGWFYDRSVIYNEQGNAKAVTMYSCTSRTGDLMKMEVALPQVHIEKIPELSSIISKSSNLPRDCAFVVACFVGNLYWSEDFVNVEPANCHLLFKDKCLKATEEESDVKSPSDTRETSPSLMDREAEEESTQRQIMISDGVEHLSCDHCGTPRCSCVASSSSVVAGMASFPYGPLDARDISGLGESIEVTDALRFHNKVPVWNPGISAYTLEFCGRALLPSVHNFQLVNERGDVVLQLGKVKNSEFNMDFGHPLSAFQAFSICLSVIQRTFVWD